MKMRADLGDVIFCKLGGRALGALEPLSLRAKISHLPETVVDFLCEVSSNITDTSQDKVSNSSDTPRYTLAWELNGEWVSMTYDAPSFTSNFIALCDAIRANGVPAPMVSLP